MLNKKWMISLLVFLGIQCALLATTFVDVPDGHWAKPSIDRVVGMGILSGFADNTYRGKEFVNRFEFASFSDSFLRIVEERYASKQDQEALEKQFDAFTKLYEEDRNAYYRVSKEEWQRMLHDLEILRAEVSELRNQGAVPSSAKP
jgi:hypothetical protein